MTDQVNTPELSENEIIHHRKEKLEAIKRSEKTAFPNQFKREHVSQQLHQIYGNHSKEDLENEKIQVKVAGRIMLKRNMGKASFIQLQDMGGQIQAYIRKNDVGDDVYEDFKHWDLGDIVGVTGYLFRTKTNELTVHAESLVHLNKTIRPLPDKFHGLHSTELRYRQRYVDLIANPDSRKVFEIRSNIVRYIRDFFHDHQYMEVETPMMQHIPGGASARPFVTHHNALDLTLFLRIAPELFLKRLVVGGFERVFEINRNFRNEGVSTQHNPEFTMLEFYQAYADYHDLMNFTEALLRGLSEHIHGTHAVEYQGNTLDFGKPFTRLSVFDAILKYNPDISAEDLKNQDKLRAICEKHGIHLLKSFGLGKLQIELFEKTVEDKLIQPTFITEYPTEVSPLSRCNDDNPFVTDRFEFFAAGFEVANGFSELNDPDDQAERFRAQVAAKESGDDEAMHFDHDYIRALEYGLPPTAGEGIGIDRLVMLLTNSASIRDVLLFPYMRPE